jgi:hypothetical protein
MNNATIFKYRISDDEARELNRLADDETKKMMLTIGDGAERMGMLQKKIEGDEFFKRQPLTRARLLALTLRLTDLAHLT